MTLRRAPRATPATLGLMVLAAIAVVGLLFGYVHVLNGAVRTGELRRIAMADHARWAWHCNTLPLEAERKQCLLKMSALWVKARPLAVL